MIKIGFTGSHGTGKTTALYKLSYDLKKKGNSVCIMNEIARDCPLKINQDTTVLSQLWIFSKQFIEEIKKLNRTNYDYMLSDRTILDNLYYLNRINEKLAISLFDNVSKFLRTFYDLIVYMPFREDYLKNDNFRDTDLMFCKEIDRNCKEFLEYYKIDFISLEDLYKKLGIEI